MNDLQRAARTRKLAYLGLIVGLFTLSMFWRGGLSLPFGDPNAIDPTEEVARRLTLSTRSPDFRAEVARRLKLDPDAGDFIRQACEKLNVPYRGGFERALDRVARLPITRQAGNLELSELDMGDPEIAGSAARVSLVGFRGVVVTVLWSSAIEKQKRGEWHDFELYARLVTRLQPNFITPWLYQGWNISYNVSVENEKLSDTFFFIARGIELLSEGDKLNTKVVRRPGMDKPFFVGSPDLRRDIGFFYQNKFTVSDKVTTLRCLMALAVMRPDDRSPARLLTQNAGTISGDKFRQFCEENPQLVRRLKTPRPNPTLGKDVTDTIAATPLEVADFLAANTDLPTRWDKSGRAKADDAQFPTLPPAFDGEKEYHPGHEDLATRYDRFDALLAARAWFQYAQQVVPPPPADKLAAAAPRRPADFDPADPDAEYKYRMPQYPALIIFRYYPARAQSYLAERLQKEGWYDADTTWDPDAGRSGEPWFKDRPAALKAQRDSLKEWEEAERRWSAFGRDNGLNPSVETQKAMDAAYSKTATEFPPGSQLPIELTPEQAERFTADDLRLRKAKDYLPQNLQVTNYQRFQDEAQAESTREMVDARKRLLAAEAVRAVGGLAPGEYAAAIAEWRRALDDPRARRYHRGDRSDTVHEFSFDLEQKLTDQYKDDPVILREVDAALTAAQAAVAFVKPAAPAVPDPFDAFARKVLLQFVAEERAVTEIAVRMRMRAGVVEAEARKQVADPAQYAYLKRFADKDQDERKSWVRLDIRLGKLMSLGFLRPPASMDGPPSDPAGGPLPQRMPSGPGQ